MDEYQEHLKNFREIMITANHFSYLFDENDPGNNQLIIYLKRDFPGERTVYSIIKKDNKLILKYFDTLPTNLEKEGLEEIAEEAMHDDITPSLMLEGFIDSLMYRLKKHIKEKSENN